MYLVKDLEAGTLSYSLVSYDNLWLLRAILLLNN